MSDVMVVLGKLRSRRKEVEAQRDDVRKELRELDDTMRALRHEYHELSITERTLEALGPKS